MPQFNHSVIQSFNNLTLLRRRYLQRQLAATAMIAIGIAMLIIRIATIFTGLSWKEQLSGGVILVLNCFLVIFFVKKLHRADIDQIARYLDRTFPQLEDSTTLLLKSPDELTLLEQLQYNRVEKALLQLPDPVFPDPMPRAAALLAFSALLAFASGFIDFDEKKEPITVETAENHSAATSATALPPPAAERVEVEIEPPAYTGLPRQSSGQLNIRAAENAKATWKVYTGKSVQRVVIRFGENDSLALRTTGDGVFEVARKLSEGGLYYFKLYGNGHSLQTDFHSIEVVPDAPPRLSLVQPQPMTRIRYGQRAEVQVKLSAEDDYGLTTAQLVATVTSGKGEGIKFREMVMEFNEKIAGTPRQKTLTRQLDLSKLGMQWGDELYFYTEARDNRQPEAGRTRSEVYFVVMEDTAQQELADTEGYGIDLVPEYFRSQRQIIIDAEKLISLKKQISVTEFKRKSADLAFDQKSLRIRYSKFLGEEFESGLTQADVPHEEGEEGEEHEDDHDDHHDHAESAASPDAKADPLEGFRHSHDSEEEATFFSKDIKFTLKDALAQMWQSELHFHLYEPQKSLPYAYKALEILKVLQQKDRIYVKRSGFNPSPLKPEKRFTGKLDDVKNGSAMRSFGQEEPQAEIRRGLAVLNRLKNSASPLTMQEKTALEAAGNALAVLAVNMPGKYLPALQHLRRLIGGQVGCSDCIRQVERAFWQVLPVPAQQVARKKLSGNKLSTIFFRNLTRE